MENKNDEKEGFIDISIIEEELADEKRRKIVAQGNVPPRKRPVKSGKTGEKRTVRRHDELQTINANRPKKSVQDGTKKELLERTPEEIARRKAMIREENAKKKNQVAYTKAVDRELPVSKTQKKKTQSKKEVQNTPNDLNTKKKNSSAQNLDKKFTVANIKKFLNGKLFGIILSAIQFVLAAVLLGFLIYSNLLPVKFFIPVCFVILLLSGITFLAMQSKKLRTISKIAAVLFSVVWTLGIYYVGQVNGMFDNIAGNETKTDVVNVYVLKDDPAKSIKDAKDYTFGIFEILDRDLTDQTIEKINKQLDSEITIKEYGAWQDIVNALYSGEVQAIIMNSAYEGIISETDGYEDFKNRIKLLMENSIVTKIEVVKDIDVTMDPFVMYISGNDNEGSVYINGRSDVNILAVVNPSTKQVLLINTPRDYYVKLSNVGQLDKLTHAGIYGIDVSMSTLGQLYGINVNYFFKVNFTGFRNVIDALGGVDVYSEFDFVTLHGGDHINVGYNHLNGKQALGFCRERYSFTAGDNQRGKNQMAVIKAIVKAMASSQLLNDFSGLMQGLEGSFATSLTSAQISALVRMQLDDMSEWNVVSYSTVGENGNDWCYALGAANYVMYQDPASIEKAKELINKVYDGEILVQE